MSRCSYFSTLWCPKELTIVKEKKKNEEKISNFNRHIGSFWFSVSGNNAWRNFFPSKFGKFTNIVDHYLDSNDSGCRIIFRQLKRIKLKKLEWRACQNSSFFFCIIYLIIIVKTLCLWYTIWVTIQSKHSAKLLFYYFKEVYSYEESNYFCFNTYLWNFGWYCQPILARF